MSASKWFLAVTLGAFVGAARASDDEAPAAVAARLQEQAKVAHNKGDQKAEQEATAAAKCAKKGNKDQAREVERAFNKGVALPDYCR